MMMEFNERQSIYLQIVGYVEEHILEEAWKPEEKIPSVRELAADLQVNPNTVMRAYEQLQQHGILQNRRGIGHYIAPGAAGMIKERRRETFTRQELPQLFRKMTLMEINFEELKACYDQYLHERKLSRNRQTNEEE